MATVDGAVAGIRSGWRRLQDEGDLLLANRATFDTVNRILRKRVLDDELGGNQPPALALGTWLGNADPIALDNLKGKVVLLHFWSARCGTSVRQLARTEALFKKFGREGLVVIGVHSAENDGSAEEIVRKTGVTYPVMIDVKVPFVNPRPNAIRRAETGPVIGETATKYSTSFVPNYFLIDKAGTVVWGFSIDPPDEKLIEELISNKRP
jgi:glutathione peroxidase-family protein